MMEFRHITSGYPGRTVLSDVSLTVPRGKITALIGPNGCGKSTLLNTAGGLIKPSAGEILLDGRPLPSYKRRELARLMALLPQSRELPRLTVERLAAFGRYPHGDMQSAKGQIEESLRRTGAWELRHRELRELSGGERQRAYIAMALCQDSGLLLLDEPTNHLDMETLEWFEDFLSKYRGTVVLVSHDRWFLDRVATRTILLEGGCCESFPGGYSKAMELREKELLEEFQQYKTQQKKIEAMKASIKRFREWGALNKNNPSFYRKAKELEKRLEKLELLERPQLEKPKLPISFEGSRTGSEVLRLRDFSLTLGDKALFRGAELLVRERDRLCLMGPNGSGKTSLIRALLGELPYGGEIRLNPSVQLGYIPQEIRFLPETETVLEAFRREIPSGEGQARGLLARYFFRAGDVFKRAGSLSGGEKVLLKLLILLQRQVNLLILDEPTNHIDVETREMLEEALSEYRGTLLFVSHDRYFIHKTATRAAYVRDGRIETAGV